MWYKNEIMATYDAETNTIDGKPIDQYRVATPKIIKAEDFHKADDKDEDKPIYGYGLLVLVAMFVLGWMFKGGWMYVVGLLMLAWPVLSVVLAFAAGVYIIKNILKSV